MFSTDELGSALRLLRTRRKMTQGDIASRAKITKTMLSSYEIGQRLPSFQSLTAVLNALGKDFHELQEALAEARQLKEWQSANEGAAGMPIQREYLGKALRLLRTQRGLTQTAIASEAKLTKAMLSTYETGSCFPTVHSLTAVLKALKCDFHGLQEALLMVLPEGERPPEFEEVRRSQLPAKEAEPALESVGGLPVEPEDGGQGLIAAFESLGEEGPSIYVQLHPALRSLTSRRCAIVWIEVSGPDREPVHSLLPFRGP